MTDLNKIKATAKKYRNLFVKSMVHKESRRQPFYVFNDAAFDQNSDLNKYYEKISEAMRNLDVSFDSAYRFTVNALDFIIDEDFTDMEDLQDRIFEYVDSLVDVYTSNLIAWTQEGFSNLSYINELLEDHNEFSNYSSLLMSAQYNAIEHIFQSVIAFIMEEAE